MKRPLGMLLSVLASGSVLAADVTFKSTFKHIDASSISFAGKKVAALVISRDDSLRMASEEALVRELTARGLQSVATYRIAPKEELESGERAKVWFEKANVEGVVALRPVSADSRPNYTPATWADPSYSTLWGYYGYGWGYVVLGAPQRETRIVVESTIYSVPRNQLVWAAVTETRDPKDLKEFMQELVKKSVQELQKQGLAKNLPK
jgi:hypothetical protein